MIIYIVKNEFHRHDQQQQIPAFYFNALSNGISHISEYNKYLC